MQALFHLRGLLVKLLPVLVR
ncbi:hypothetical protein EMIT051CA3_30886 [Pseudomonas chlororaphis]